MAGAAVVAPLDNEVVVENEGAAVVVAAVVVGFPVIVAASTQQVSSVELASNEHEKTPFPHESLSVGLKPSGTPPLVEKPMLYGAGDDAVLPSGTNPLQSGRAFPTGMKPGATEDVSLPPMRRK